MEQHLSGGGVAVVHVLSHGDHTLDGGVYVVGSDAARSKQTRVEEWRIAVADDPSTPMTLFLLDLCHAGAANRYWQPPVSGAQERAWVIAATGADRPAYAGRLIRAATTVIHRITSGELDLAPTVRGGVRRVVRADPQGGPCAGPRRGRPPAGPDGDPRDRRPT